MSSSLAVSIHATRHLQLRLKYNATASFEQQAQQLEKLFASYDEYPVITIQKRNKSNYAIISFPSAVTAETMYNKLHLKCKLNNSKLYFEFTKHFEIDIIHDIQHKLQCQSSTCRSESESKTSSNDNHNNNNYNNHHITSFINTFKLTLSRLWRIQDKQFIICITGPSGGGKTSLCNSLCRLLKYHFNNVEQKVFHGDSYFATKHCYFDKQLGLRNMECKEACDYNKILNDLNQTKAKIIILEGLLLINCVKIIEKCDVVICIDCEKNICFERRKSRKTRKNIELFTKYYNRYVWPEYCKNRDFYWNHVVPQLEITMLLDMDSSNKNQYDVTLNVVYLMFLASKMIRWQQRRARHHCSFM